MRKILLSVFFACLLINSNLSAQSCFNVAAGNDTTISCLQPCLDLKARIPDIRTSEDYQVISIPYNPYPFVTAAPLYQLPCMNDQDDKYGDVATLPFVFCFYGANYKDYVLGTNGIISFDISNALTGNNYIVSDPLPFIGSGTATYACPAPPFPDGTLYPKLAIMGAYQDLLPEPADPTYKIEARVEGTAPCRRFVMAYSNVKLYNCQNLRATFEVVLHEGTGLIDIFIDNNPLCGGSNTIIGIQKDGLPATPFSAPPGRNLFQQQIIKEAWRFVPSGPTSLLDSVAVYKNGVWVARGTTTILGNGELEATFSGICQFEDSMSYVIRAFYRQCDNPAMQTEGSDTIIVYKTLNPISTNITPALCPASGNGQITVTSPLGANIEYSSDGINWQTSPVFNLPGGTYTITARLIGSLCTGETTVTITAPMPFSTNGIKKDLLCNGQNIGEVLFTPAGPDVPFEFSANGGVTYQTSGLFTGLAAGSHTFRIKNNLGCTQDTTIIITEPTALNSSASVIPATCPDNDGNIDITASGGTPVYEYSIDNGISYQPANVFLNLPSGNYNAIKVKDANGCISNLAATVILNDTMRLELGPDSTICFGSSIILLPQTNALTDTFKWTPAATLDDDAARNPVASPTDTIKYYLAATWGVCQRTDSVTVNVLHKPVANAGSDTTICYKTNAILYGSATNLSGTVNYAWSPPDSLNTPNNASTVVRIDTTRKFILTVTDNYGCNFSVTDSVYVIMQPPLVAFAGNDTNAILGRPHQMLATGGVDYVWSPTSPLNNPFIANPLATLFTDTYFHVFVTDAIGCTDDDDVFVKAYEGPTYYLPNAFSPNSDGLNDIFRPTPVGIRSTDYFRIFNRYGALMYETRQWMQGWDGTLKGKPAAAGTYVWMIKGIDKNGAVVEMKGTVILIR
ncbi:MAG: gliding motility-associated C-terminal domain-containing protein [Ferruginibacter sp.]